MTTRWRVTVVALALIAAASRAQDTRDPQLLFDRILDTYVRDGDVYYRALKIERDALDRYVSSLDVPAAQLARAPHADQLAFWMNAYDALVLRTVINNYPIKAVTREYPDKSIRQIPGAFEELRHRVAGESLTLDAIEKTKILPLGDARAIVALGRGAAGSGRLRSEAFRASRLDAQLDEALKEFVQRATILRIDAAANQLLVSPLFGWRQEAFIAMYGGNAAAWPGRSPLEVAIVELALPKLFPSERAVLRQNTFQLTYAAFDWRLNDLSGGLSQ